MSRLSVSAATLLGFMCILVVIIVVIFVLEAFLAVLYKGPGSQFAVCMGFTFHVPGRKS